MSSMSAARPVAFAAGQLASGMAFYRGYSLRETAGAAATVRLWDNTSAAGVLLATIALAANSSKDFVAPHNVMAQNGIFVQVVAGTVEGSVYLG